MTEMLIDGRVESAIPADDRGLLYGDALFETVAFRSGEAPLWRWHWQRLIHGCERIGLVPPAESLVHDECLQLAGRSRCVIRLTLTRGSGGQAYVPPEPPHCRRIVHRREWPEVIADQQRDGVSVITSSIRLATGSALAGLKHCNRLEQVLAARERKRLGVDEALMYDADQRLVEAIAANVIAVGADEVLTPKTTRAGVSGVGLSWLQSQPDIEIKVADLDSADLARATELVVVNSIAGIRPVVKIDSRPMAIGPRCREWQRLWMERLKL
ncbi:aminodeoxychorismate lyase [Wenzhouxiangella sp. AB-CW3]|uniref:aminodeoxychorismate lyase n=1 Tax=Wenzhouxiangella sp. AB-CW3 TaxID=2771012 RepID=UPI00168B3399|nr:aminodeoxychorismate lyase [Wenzhouxiangella sp. AB-CW3]QOC24005.1 aminodeoxychorismate lyase [Wenzhouxiangella sp. AB-CW3]